jgi:hypothetical protein
MDTATPSDMPSAMPSATAEGERWISLRELAKIRGVSQHSATRLVRRNGWRRQRDNRGHVLALVPIEALSRQSDMPSAVAEGQTSTGLDHLAEYVAAYRVAIEAKDGAIAALRAAIEAKDGELTAVRGMVDVMQAQIAAAQQAADRARAEAQAAQDRAEAAERADAAWRAGGRLARAWRAWRGE